MNDNLSSDAPVEAPVTNDRPGALTFFCVLSFISGFFRFLFYIFVTFIAGAVSDNVTVNGEQVSTDGFKIFAVGGLILTLVSLYGVVQMWQLKKIGFYVYAGVSIFSLILLTIDSVGIPYFSIALSVFFIAMFGMNLKHMR